MGGTHTVTMGDRGRLVVPADVRERHHLDAGTRLILLEEGDRLVLITREHLLAEIRRKFADGPDVVAELIAERRAEAAREAGEPT